MSNVLALQDLPSIGVFGLEAIAPDDGEGCTICTWTCDWTTCYCTSIEVG